MTTDRGRPCYAWGGRQVDGNFTACDLSASHSMCCRMNLPSDHYAPDGCLPNGLCSYFGNSLSGIPTQAFWIESCTDQSWQDPICANLVKYVDASSGMGCYRNGNGDVPLGYCPQSGVYCCNKNIDLANKTDCCDTAVKDNVIVRLAIASMAAITASYQGGYYTTFLPSMPSMSPSSTSHSSSSDNTTPTSTVNTKEGPLGLSTGASIGIGIIAGWALVALILVACLFVSRSRGHKSDPDPPNDMVEKHQVPTNVPSHELPGDTSLHEIS